MRIAQQICFSVSLCLLWSCNGIPTPGPTPEPTPTSAPWECNLGYPGCHEYEPPLQCSSAEAPCWFNPTQDPYHCEEAVRCAGEPTPPPPVAENQWFPIVPQNQITAVRGNPGNYGSKVNAVMAELTGCFVGQEPCPISFPVDLWFQAVCKKMHETGWYCGRHIESPIGHVCPPGGGCSDQISVKNDSFCDGDFHENYRIINPGENGVRWFPGAKLDAWNVDCTGATWPADPTEPPVDPTPEPTPSGACVDPDPTGREAQFILKKHHQDWDSTYRVKGSDYCDLVCSPLEPDVCYTGRQWCPMRMEGDPERAACYTIHVDVQQWWCDGQPIEASNETGSQARCHGQVKTCTEDGRTCAGVAW